MKASFVDGKGNGCIGLLAYQETYFALRPFFETKLAELVESWSTVDGVMYIKCKDPRKIGRLREELEELLPQLGCNVEKGEFTYV